MPIDAMLGRRKPFTAKKALAYILTLVGLAATIALPIVLMLANNNINEQKARLSAQDLEIERLKSENQMAIPRENDDTVIAAKQVLAKEHEEPAAQLAADKSVTKGPNAFENKLALLHERVVGAETRHEQSNSEDFESRLARLHEKVVQRRDENEVLPPK